MAAESNWSAVKFMALIFHGRLQEPDTGVGITGIMTVGFEVFTSF